MYALWHLRIWPWGHMRESEWYSLREFYPDPHEAFIEGWCRGDDLGPFND